MPSVNESPIATNRSSPAHTLTDAPLPERLARAIAAKPAVLLLDDPLSALDTKTEETVTARLREVLAGTTTLIVAHRTSTVALADRVALLDDGRVVAVGTHTELMASSARYRWVIANQEEERRRDQDIETLTGELELRAIQEEGR